MYLDWEFITINMNETKEEILAYIKQETGWDDAKCLEWYTQQEEADKSANEEIPIWHAYYYLMNDKPKFVVSREEPPSKLEDKIEDHRTTCSERAAKEFIEEWKEPYEQQKAWDKYINRK
jgi:hypothetical protein